MLKRKFSGIVCISLFILATELSQGTAYHNEALNPVKAISDDVWQPRSTRLAVRANDELTCEKPNIYVCEVPPDVISPTSDKFCRYRSEQYHAQVYKWVAGRGCLLYTPNFLFAAGVNTINLNAGCFYGNWFAPCLEFAKEDGTCGCYPFDPSFEVVSVAVRDAMISSAHGRWERCFYSAEHCCNHVMGNSTSDESECAATFDGWTCWESAPADTIAYEVCSEFAYSNSEPSCHHYSSKQCYANGTWEVQTDYSTCSITSRLLKRYRFHIAILSFSIISCLPAVFVFFFYKRLRITRVALHRNLLIAIIIRNVLVIVSRATIYMDELTNTGTTVLSQNGVPCRVLSVAERVAANFVFVCMLVEGLYLHRMIVAVFKKKFNIKWLYGFGAAIAIVPALAWSAVMATINDHSCWLIYTVDNIQWIMDAPRIAVLLVNTFLFIDVLRVLLTKIRNSENAHQLSTAKATLFLMPIFGVQFLLTLLRPNTTDCTFEQVYYYISYTIEGVQGFIVAILYCYLNKEVHALLKVTYKNTESAVVSRVRGSNSHARPSAGPSAARRATYSTGVHSHDDSKDQYASIRPNLHVAEIISIQASEKLAEILEPVYESIENGISNDGYDSTERSGDDDSGFIPTRDSKIDDYYGFTNASSVSIDCQDWIRCVSSPSSSVYNNSLNDYETKYLEHKFPNNARNINSISQTVNRPVVATVNENDSDETHNPVDLDGIVESEYSLESDYEDFENMIRDILQFIEVNEVKNLNVDMIGSSTTDPDDQTDSPDTVDV